MSSHNDTENAFSFRTSKTWKIYFHFVPLKHNDIGHYYRRTIKVKSVL